MGAILTPYETRDLITWLLTLTKENDEKAPAYEVKELSLTGPKKMDESAKTTKTPAPQPIDPENTVSEENKIDPAVMELGSTQYILCVACHGQTGQGTPNIGPPLSNSEWVTGPVENLIGIQLRGLGGPITVAGKDYSFPAPMAAMGAGQPDANLAAVLTYIRNSFGNSAPAVTNEMVAKYREDNKEILSQTPPPALKVSELISPFAATAGDAPAPTLAEVPSAGLGASGSDIFIFLVIGGLSVLGALRMKASNK